MPYFKIATANVTKLLLWKPNPILGNEKQQRTKSIQVLDGKAAGKLSLPLGEDYVLCEVRGNADSAAI